MRIDKFQKEDAVIFKTRDLTPDKMLGPVYTMLIRTGVKKPYWVSIPHLIVDHDFLKRTYYFTTLCTVEDFKTPYVELKTMNARVSKWIRGVALSEVYAKCYDTKTDLYFFIPINLIKLANEQEDTRTDN